MSFSSQDGAATACLLDEKDSRESGVRFTTAKQHQREQRTYAQDSYRALLLNALLRTNRQAVFVSVVTALSVAYSIGGTVLAYHSKDRTLFFYSFAGFGCVFLQLVLFCVYAEWHQDAPTIKQAHHFTPRDDAPRPPKFVRSATAVPRTPEEYRGDEYPTQLGTLYPPRCKGMAHSGEMARLLTDKQQLGMVEVAMYRKTDAAYDCLSDELLRDAIIDCELGPEDACVCGSGQPFMRCCRQLQKDLWCLF